MATDLTKTVLLFYQDYERDRYLRYDRYLQRLLRPIYRHLTHKQKVTGFYVWYRLLVKALERSGMDVRVNDYHLARANPDHPVGLLGYPEVLDQWSLPNPAILGPGLFDHPLQAPRLMVDPRFRYYIVTCEWMHDLFAPFYGCKCIRWHAGIDVFDWTETRGVQQDIDVLVYDKIRWNREYYEASLLQPILGQLAQQGLRYHTVRYRQYDHDRYRELLSRSRCMIFLCEHETQGLAYQEAMSSNLPILAWDNGFWLDPSRKALTSEPVAASSVPYFSEECGRKFTCIEEFASEFEQFWRRLDQYQPRNYVVRELSMERSAGDYLRYYEELRRVATPAQ